MNTTAFTSSKGSIVFTGTPGKLTEKFNPATIRDKLLFKVSEHQRAIDELNKKIAEYNELEEYHKMQLATFAKENNLDPVEAEKPIEASTGEPPETETKPITEKAEYTEHSTEHKKMINKAIKQSKNLVEAAYIVLDDTKNPMCLCHIAKRIHKAGYIGPKSTKKFTVSQLASMLSMQLGIYIKQHKGKFIRRVIRGVYQKEFEH